MPFISDKQSGFIPDKLPLTGFVSDRDAQQIAPEPPVSIWKETLKQAVEMYPSPLESLKRLVKDEE